MLFLTGAAQAKLECSRNIVGYREDAPCYYERVEVRNPTGRASAYSLEFVSYRSGARIHLDPPLLEPGAERVHHLAVATDASYVTCNLHERGRSSPGLGMSGYVTPKTFLNICAMERWASEKDLSDYSVFLNMDEARRYSGTGSSGAGAGGIVSQIEPRAMPDNWLCYQPFRAVFIADKAFKRMGAVERDALMKWVEMGGSVTVYDAPEETSRQRMLGKIHFEKSNPITVKRKRPEWGRRPAIERFYGAGGESSFPYIVRQAGGRVGGLVLATLFVALAGPVNFFYWRRRRRVRMLLLSVPAISIAFCLCITAYFVATQGFARRGGTFSVTLLDEATDSALTFSRHCLYSGLYPLGGFQFDREALFYPLKKPDDREGFKFDLTGGQTLQSGLFSPSFNFHYFTAMPSSTRERLIVDFDEATVINGFEKPVELLVLRGGGKTWKAPRLEPGEKGRLEAIDVGGRDMQEYYKLSDAEIKFFQRSMLEFCSETIVKDDGVYVARVDAPLEAEQGGVTIRGGHCALLVGRMAPAEGAAP